MLLFTEHMKFFILTLILPFIGFNQSSLFVKYTFVDSFSVYFPNGKDNALDKKSLINRIKKLPKDSSYYLKITGFTDTVGSIEFNKMLSSKRMNSAVNEMIKQKVNLITIDSININEGKSKKNTADPEQLRRVDGVLYFITEKITLNTIYDLSINFRSGTDLILLESYPILQQISEIMNKNEAIKIELGGHVCCADEYTLSLNRAKRVAYYLVKHGIAANRIKVEGYSNKRPKVKEVNAETEQINRRVELIFRK